MRSFLCTIKQRLLLSIILFSVTTTSLADLDVVPNIVDFAAQDVKKQTIVITNYDKQTAYLQITAAKVEQPGTPQEHDVVIKNPADLGILISPNRLIVPGGQTRTMRLLLTQPVGNTDNIYRLTILPVISKLDVKGSDENLRAGIKVIVGYGILVIARPNQANPQISVTRKGKAITIVNTGNTNILLQRGQQCVSTNKCINLESRRLYAGNKWTFTAPYSNAVTFIKTYMGENDLLKIN